MKVYDYLVEYKEDNRWMPVLAEIAEKAGISGPAVWYHLDQLEKRGWIERKKHHKRWIKIL